MQIHVYDTYVKTKQFGEIHFDVITKEKDLNKALEYGKKYLKSIGEENAVMTSNECNFCHSQSAPKPVEDGIKKDGYFIQKMQGCP